MRKPSGFQQLLQEITRKQIHLISKSFRWSHLEHCLSLHLWMLVIEWTLPSNDVVSLFAPLQLWRRHSAAKASKFPRRLPAQGIQYGGRMFAICQYLVVASESFITRSLLHLPCCWDFNNALWCKGKIIPLVRPCWPADDRAATFQLWCVYIYLYYIFSMWLNSWASEDRDSVETSGRNKNVCLQNILVSV